MCPFLLRVTFTCLQPQPGTQNRLSPRSARSGGAGDCEPGALQEAGPGPNSLRALPWWKGWSRFVSAAPSLLLLSLVLTPLPLSLPLSEFQECQNWEGPWRTLYSRVSVSPGCPLSAWLSPDLPATTGWSWKNRLELLSPSQREVSCLGHLLSQPLAISKAVFSHPGELWRQEWELLLS